ncbi:zinc finger SWIM domain-containing protein 8 homolog [Panonychus citri]|uniref:zinc finger SWIM domain-containing protein 8 homolog n=1 Tax=Panonychus citri TaxID=50023 RepID=UPI00230774A8|nr:zinc finger SWIM domain-containing protein 8 homolog [Panonychus citri]
MLEEDDSFEDSERFEDESICSASDHDPASTNHWRGWKRDTSLPVWPPHPKTSGELAKQSVLPLVEIAAKEVACHIPFEIVEHFYPPIPAELQLRIAFWSFPESEEDIRLYSCLANSSDLEFMKGETLVKQGCVRELLQIGFHLSATIIQGQMPSSHKGSYNVAVTFDRRRITTCNCTCSSSASWCSHIVAVCLFRIYQPNQVRLRAPVSESLSRLERDELQKFAQYLISELPQQILPTAQRLLDDLLSKQSTDINKFSGAPDPTAGASINDQTSWWLDESQLHENIRKILVKMSTPMPIVFSDPNYLQLSLPSVAVEWASWLRPLRAREPEGMWNLLAIVLELFMRGDRNAVPLLKILTEEVLTRPQIVAWWFQTKMSLNSGYSGHNNRNNIQSNTHASQHACTSICDEIVSLWRLACLNPGLTPNDRDLFHKQLREWHITTLETIWKTRLSNSNNNNGNNNFHKKSDFESFPGFKPAMEACLLDWEDYQIPGVTYSEDPVRSWYCPCPHIHKWRELVSEEKTKPRLPENCSNNSCNVKKESLVKRNGHDSENRRPQPTSATQPSTSPPPSSSSTPTKCEQSSPSLPSQQTTPSDSQSISSTSTPSVNNSQPQLTSTTGKETSSTSTNSKPISESTSIITLGEEQIRVTIKSMTDPLEILLARTEALHAHGFMQESCHLAVLLAEEMLINPPNLLLDLPNPPSRNKKIRRFNPACHQISLLASATMTKAAFLCQVLSENVNYHHLAFKIGVFGLELARPPASTKALEVKLFHQEQELVNLLKKIPLKDAELDILRVKAEILSQGNYRARGDAALPIALANYIFDALVYSASPWSHDSFSSPTPQPCVILCERKQSDELLGLEASISALGMKANVSEAEHPLLCEGTRKQRGDFIVELLVHYRDEVDKLNKIMDKVLDQEVHQLYKNPPPGSSVNNQNANNSNNNNSVNNNSNNNKYNINTGSPSGVTSPSGSPNVDCNNKTSNLEIASTSGQVTTTTTETMGPVTNSEEPNDCQSIKKTSTEMNDEEGAIEEGAAAAVVPKTSFPTSEGNSQQPPQPSSSSSSSSSTTTTTTTIEPRKIGPSDRRNSDGERSEGATSPSWDESFKAWEARFRCINFKTNKKQHSIGMASIDSSAPETTSSDNSPTVVRRSLWVRSGSDSGSSGESSDSFASSSSGDKNLKNKMSTTSASNLSSAAGVASTSSNANRDMHNSSLPSNSRVTLTTRMNACSINDNNNSKVNTSAPTTTATPSLASSSAPAAPLAPSSSSNTLNNNNCTPSSTIGTSKHSRSFKGRVRMYPTVPNQPSEASSYFMHELAKTILEKAGGSSTSAVLFSQSTVNQNHQTPHRNLHMCALKIALYSLGLHNAVSPNWLSRTYCHHVSWITNQTVEIGAQAINFLIDTWEGHLTPAEAATLADRASGCNDPITKKAASKLALSCLPQAQALNPTEIHRAILQCKESSDSMLQEACLAVETAAKGGGVCPEVLFHVSRKWYELYEAACSGETNNESRSNSRDHRNRPPYVQASVGEFQVPSSSSPNPLHHHHHHHHHGHSHHHHSFGDVSGINVVTSLSQERLGYNCSLGNSINSVGVNNNTGNPNNNINMINNNNKLGSNTGNPNIDNFINMRSANGSNGQMVSLPQGPLQVIQSLPCPPPPYALSPATAPYSYGFFPHGLATFPPGPPTLPFHPAFLQTPPGSNPNFHHQYPPAAYFTTTPPPANPNNAHFRNHLNHPHAATLLNPVTGQSILSNMIIAPQVSQRLPQMISVAGGNASGPIVYPFAPQHAGHPFISQQQALSLAHQPQLQPHQQLTQKQLLYLLSAYRVAILAMEALGRKNHDERPTAKFARNPSYEDDVKWLLEVVKKLGTSYFQDFCICTVNSITSPFVLLDILQDMAKYISQSSANSMNISNAYRSPILVPLIQKCQQMFVQGIYAKLNISAAKSDAESEEFLILIRQARQAFYLTAGGPTQFSDVIQTIRRSKNCKKELWQLVSNYLQTNPMTV